ncbi:hypothetical protein F2P81_024538 [Scophthalmus maximus]|uniref:Uncharacterized protein n=1 Tax=Scophthalmus maximus TaxID=52904 RepID=A0A6A4RV55_SCOMX|nr:hypothetical protein F2P81_024538 [Scophthalmus maximus]
MDVQLHAAQSSIEKLQKSSIDVDEHLETNRQWRRVTIHLHVRSQDSSPLNTLDVNKSRYDSFFHIQRLLPPEPLRVVQCRRDKKAFGSVPMSFFSPNSLTSLLYSRVNLGRQTLSSSECYKRYLGLHIICLSCDNNISWNVLVR